MKKTCFLILWSVLLFACKDPNMDQVYTDNISNFPASTYMDNDSTLGVSLWVDLLKHADMFNTLNLQANYTIFVPDDAAVKAYLTAKGVNNVNQIAVDDAKLLIRFHTISGTKYSAVSFTEGLMPDSTASGDYLSTSFMDEGGRVLVNEEGIVTKTVQVTNAYLHILNKVLTPVTETIWDKLQKPEFSVMKEAFTLTGYAERLNAITTTETTGTGALVTRKYRYTLFAVPNDVFQAAGINNAGELATYLGAGTDYLNTANSLHRFMAYRMLNQQYSFAELSKFAETDKVRSRNYNTVALNQLINISEVDKTIYINWDKTNKVGVKLTRLNENCKNGVMHHIDGLLPVKSPAPTTVRWELTDFPELSYISFYRKAAGSSTQQRLINQGDVASYKWMSVPESKVGLTYELSNKNDAVKVRALNGDYLILSLGTFGWVEMNTPTIIAGKYSVFIEHFNAKGNELGGRLMFIVDGQYVGTQVPTSGASKTTDQYLTTTKVGEVTFTETVPHKIRILAGDNSSAYLDCIRFVPM
jgi:uncharacterized surface protein with fasciclin (FAS1) repeats